MSKETVSNTILVTGGTGFVGQSVVNALLEDGRHVRVLTRNPEHPIFGNTSVKPIVGDITQPETLPKAVKSAGAVIHLAGHREHLMRSGKNEAWIVNKIGTDNLISAAVAAEVPIFINTSSAARYGNCRGEVIFESQKPNPNDDYSQSKLAAEWVVYQYHQKIKTVTLIPAEVYGPEGRGYRLWFLKQPFFVNGGKGYINPCFVRNLGQAFNATLKALEKGKKEVIGEKFNIADVTRPGLAGVPWADYMRYYEEWTGKTAINISETVALFLAKLMQSFNEHRLPAYSPHRIQAFIGEARLSLQKAEEFLGYQPPYTFAQGMEETRQWFKSQGKLK